MRRQVDGIGQQLGDLPVQRVGGWADYLSRAVPRILSQIPSPGRGLIGPWGHQYPQDATPGPAMGFLLLAGG